MVDLEGKSREALQEALSTATDAKAAERLMAALAYKDGVTGGAFAARYGIPRSTVYSWLNRFEERDLEDAMYDDRRPGRPSKLGDDQRAELLEDLERPPAEHGYEATEWHPSLVRNHLETKYGVAYSVVQVRRILNELDG